MPIIAFIIGSLLIMIVLWDVFETVVLPRRVTRRYRLVRLFYHITWRIWSGIIPWSLRGSRQETLLSYYGPLSLILLLVLWAVVVMTGFGLLFWSQENALKIPEGTASLRTCLYFSGTSFFTLGLGDIAPLTRFSRFLVVAEAGMGFGLLAMVISYLPAINQAFSRREVGIGLLDARAGSPPTAGEMLNRNPDGAALAVLLHEWEQWCAELLESHLSYPMLVFFRSQHDNQSWLSALASILDLSAFVVCALEGECVHQARLTFAIARHTVVDLALVLHTAPDEPRDERLGREALAKLCSLCAAKRLPVRSPAAIEGPLKQMRQQYEGYLRSLSVRLLLPLPPWFLPETMRDNWQVSAWDPGTDTPDHF